MTPKQLKTRLDDLATRLWAIAEELEHLKPELALDVDRRAANGIVTDLHWATENCTVMGLHQIGRAMDDNMGVTDQHK
jgi:hypothetical protein